MLENCLAIGKALGIAAATGLMAGCTGDRAQAPEPPAKEVVLLPASALVAVADTVRFRAVARVRGRPADSPPVSLTALGGQIGQGGLYTSGSAPGVYAVAADIPAWGVADTAVVLVASRSGRAYETHFRLKERPLSEGGRWLGGGSVGLDWSDVSSEGSLAIGHEVGASYTDATALLTGPWPPDQMASATVNVASSKDRCFQEVGLRLRSSLGPHRNSGYEISYKVSRGDSAYLIIVRWNGPLGDYTYLAKRQGARFGARDGDVVSARVIGDTIIAYKNGVEMARASDGTYAGGSPGMGFNLENAPRGCAGTNADYGFTSFAAADAR